jgi:hypothetical protein
LRSPPLVLQGCPRRTSSGISPAFAGLFLTEGQVAHVLLTRSPLYSSPCGDFLARLACVRHAASVRSEPGSNSPSLYSLSYERSRTPRPGGRRCNYSCVHPQARSNDILLSENKKGRAQKPPAASPLERPRGIFGSHQPWNLPPWDSLYTRVHEPCQLLFKRKFENFRKTHYALETL